MTVRAASIVTTRPASAIGPLVAGSNTGPAIYPPARLHAHRSGRSVVGVVEAGYGRLMQLRRPALVRFGDACVTQTRRRDRSHPISDLSSGLSNLRYYRQLMAHSSVRTFGGASRTARSNSAHSRRRRSLARSVLIIPRSILSGIQGRF